MATILVVDDEPTIVETLLELLELEGHTPVAAVNGEEAMDRLAEAVPDLVLLDYMMPVRDGLYVARAMRADTRLAAVPVVMMTATPRSLANETKVWDVLLPKPFSANALRAAMATVLAPRT